MTGFRIAPNVGVLDDGETVYVAALPAGPIHVLVDVAAEVWRSATATSSTGLLPSGGTSGDEASHYLAAMVDARLLMTEDDR